MSDLIIKTLNDAYYGRFSVTITTAREVLVGFVRDIGTDTVLIKEWGLGAYLPSGPDVVVRISTIVTITPVPTLLDPDRHTERGNHG